MARPKKKGQAGAAKNFITRTQAVRKLQISLPDFRRLCIFKGIYPREPRNKKKVSKSATQSTTFYYTKDIQYLLHEPLLQKFREHKALAKKIGRALGRGEAGDAARLEKKTPRMTLDHIIKERYPTFVDALRDLDDALSMLFLFANLPSTSAVPPKTIALCQRLCLEFEHYLIVSHSLRKSFLSIKGIYYQATIQGQDILWLVPYKFVQRTSGDIDFRIMGTFVEFYTTLLGFVNFRLYTSIGLVYPPKFDAKKDEAGGELGAFTLEGRAIESADKAPNGGSNVSEKISAAAQAEADKLAALPAPNGEGEGEKTLTSAKETESTEATADETIDTFEPAAADADVLPQPSAETSEIASLFEPFTFFLSRETPRGPLEFLLKAFGCKRVGWDASVGAGAWTTDESDPSITHQIVDRPPLPQESLPQVPDAAAEEAGAERPKALWPRATVPGRTYVQPQWVWDCVNAGKLLRPDLYAPGSALPPHLSPWVKPKKGMYDPSKPLAEQEREGEADEYADEEMREIEGDAAEEEDESEAEERKKKKGDMSAVLDRDDEVEAGEGMDVADTEDEDESEEGEDDEWNGVDEDMKEDESEEDEDEDEEDEEEASRRQHQRELEAEAAGIPLEAVAGKPKSKAELARKRAAKKRREEQEEIERRKMMLSRKKRKGFEKMEYSNRKRDEEAEKLRAKRRRIEKGLQK